MYISNLETFYCINEYRLSLLVNVKLNFIALANKNGRIMFWNSFEHLLKDGKSCSELKGHSGDINKIQLYENKYLLTVGSTDGLVMSFKHKKYR
jgi:hypothetical protein